MPVHEEDHVQGAMRDIVNLYRPSYTPWGAPGHSSSEEAKTREDLSAHPLQSGVCAARDVVLGGRHTTRDGSVRTLTLTKEKWLCPRTCLEQMEDNACCPCAVFLVMMCP